MKPIVPRRLKSVRISVSGSKSLTHRALLAAGLARGVSVIENGLSCEDTHLTMEALGRLGAVITQGGEKRLHVTGCNGRFRGFSEALYLGNSGTSLRFLTALVVLGKGAYRLTGTERMGRRPLRELMDALRQLGVSIRSLENDGYPPVEVFAGNPLKTTARVDCTKSSQFLSGLLLMAPCTPGGMEIEVTHGPVSRPYVDLTLDVMDAFGVDFQRNGYERFIVPGGQSYRGRVFRVEGDCSQAGYFWAAAAVTGGSVTVTGIDPASRQGDLRLLELLEHMGCSVTRETGGIRVTGGSLHAIEADLSDMPDAVPTLAVTAAYAAGKTRIRGVPHLKGKESDRIDAVVKNLRRMGIHAEAHEDGLTVQGGVSHGAVIDPRNDHRIAMSFAVAGLNTPGVQIENASCVTKSFPDFWNVWDRLGGS